MNENFKMHKETKRFLSTLDKHARSAWRKAMNSAQVNYDKSEWMTMMYDIGHNGKKLKQQ